QDNGPPQSVVEALREAHAQLEASHERFERIARTIPCVLYDFTMVDGVSRFLYLSAPFEEFFELKPEAVIEKPNRFWLLLHPDDLVRMQAEQVHTVESREIYNAEVRVTTPSGRMRWIRFSALPNPSHAGSVPVWSGFMFDITDRKLMEQEIRRLAVTDS